MPEKYLNERPVLSVIIPTCNRESTLTRAIQSVVVQGIEGLEIIVVNDGDEDIAPFNPYGCDVEVRVVRTEGRRGPAEARNLGVQAAGAEYVTFLDDDDIYMPGRLKNMLGLMQESEYVFVSSGRFSERDDFKKIVNISRQQWGVISKDTIKFANDIDIGFMVRRSLFLHIGGFDRSFTNLEDWDLVIRLLRHGDGYKLERLDYCVNVDTSRVRVSNNDYIGYLELADKHDAYYGNQWRIFMLSMSQRLRGTLTFRLAFVYSLKGRSLKPLDLYLRYIYRQLLQFLGVGVNGS